MKSESKIKVRPARPADYPAVRGVIARAFGTADQANADEANLWDYLVAYHPSLRPEGVRVAEVDGQVVACTVVLPQRIRIRRDWTPGAVITLVACDPDHQNRGHGSNTVLDALAYAGDQGLALAILYGHPDYYPRFGFVPVLPGYYTTLANETLDSQAYLENQQPCMLRPATEDDVTSLAALYEEKVSIYPCATERSAALWQWRVREKEARPHDVLVLPDRRGYAVVTREREQNALFVHEAAASDDRAARQLLAGLLRESLDGGLAFTRLALPPDSALVRLALLWGAEQNYRPARAGMVAVCRWEPLLPAGYQVGDDGLFHDGRLVLRAGRRALTELVVGYRGIDELLLAEAAALTVGNKAPAAEKLENNLVERLRRDFPSGFPKWSLEPFWG